MVYQTILFRASVEEVVKERHDSRFERYYEVNRTLIRFRDRYYLDNCQKTYKSEYKTVIYVPHRRIRRRE